MWFSIDFSSHTPVYVQIKDNIKASILSGKLKTGDYIPSIRNLAKDIGVNINTVARAYRELEIDGVIRPQRGEGYVVVGVQSEQIREELKDELLKLLGKCKASGVKQNELIEAVKKVYSGNGGEEFDTES